MDLVCENCSQPNPPGAKLCSRCSSVFPALLSETLLAPSASEVSTPGSSATLVDTSGTGTVIVPPADSGTMIDASAGTGTVVDVGGGSGTVVLPPEGGRAEPARNVVKPSSRGTGQRLRADSGAFVGGTVEPGTQLGSRYEIVKLLGKGGMGAVYLARDLDLGRDVAMKLIAPHLANEGAVLERFKREIQLSSIVTHSNVLRVYDLGEADGLKFLTMQFIEGETLADLLARERPLPLDRMLSLFRQICDGLAAAHEKGVFHRDLKPQNVMLDAAGHVYLMDFGLATSRTMTAMTQAGAVMGTPQYMSPEQVKGTATDGRSDIFSLGVMLYEMLSGELPFTGDSLFEIMVKRTLGPPKPVGELKPSIPPYLQQMVERCLAIDPAQRYASMAELLADLDAGTVKAPIKKRRGPSRTQLLVGGALAAMLAVGVGGTILATKITKPAGLPKTVTMLVGDFDNRTGEAVFNGTLEPALVNAFEGASFLTIYNRSSAQRLADRLKLEGEGLSEKRARLIAQREGVGVVVTGFVEREASGYRVGIRAVDAFTGQRVFEQAEPAESKDVALAVVPRLAAKARGKLGDETPVGVQLKEALTYTASSLEAAHEFALGATLASAGKLDQARTHYLASLNLDPNLARAYSGLALLEMNSGRGAEAQKYFKEMLARVDRMTQREKYRALGLYYSFSKDIDKALDAYGALVKEFPADSAGLTQLSVMYAQKRDYAKGLEMARRYVSIYPNDVVTLNNIGQFELILGQVDEAIAQQRKVLEISPTYALGYFGLAMAQLSAGQRDEAIATWEKMKAIGAAAASVAVEGLADLALYEGRIADARKLLENAIRVDVESKDTDGQARKLLMLAEIDALTTKGAAAAISGAKRALSLSTADYITMLAGTVLAKAGDSKSALTLAGELDTRIGDEARMNAEIIRGAVEQRRGNNAEAIARFRAAVQKLDAWVARYALGRAYLEAGSYAQALDELEKCSQRRGEAADLSQDNLPSYRFFAPVLYQLGRTHDGLNSPAAAPAYRSFLEIKKSDEDPMVQDARKRLAALFGAPGGAAAAPAK